MKKQATVALPKSRESAQESLLRVQSETGQIGVLGLNWRHERNVAAGIVLAVQGCEQCGIWTVRDIGRLHETAKFMQLPFLIMMQQVG